MQGFHPQKHKTQPKNYANGGIVKGPGSGTSDSVPAMVPKDGYVMPADSVQALGFKPGMRAVQLSDGEAVLNPQQVQAAGGFQALDAMKAATHTPVPEQGAEGQKFFFVNGGPLDDEKRKPFMPTLAPEVQQGMTKMYSASMPPQPQPTPAAVQPPAASGFVSSMERNQRALDASTASGPAVPAAKPVNPTEVEGWRTKAVMDGAAEDAQAAWDRGQVGQAAGAVARGAITAVPTAIGEFAYNTVAPVAGAAKGFWNGLTGGADATQIPVTPAQAAPVVPPATQAQPADRPPAATQAVAPSGQPEKPGTPAAQANAQAPAVTQVAPGVFQHGRGQFSDNAAGMGFKPGFTGQPSAQNMDAADNLAQRSAARGFTPQVQAPAPVASQNLTPPDTGQGYGFGLANSSRIQQRNLSMDVQQNKPGAKLALQGFLQQQADAPGQQIERDRLAQSATNSAADRGFRSQELTARMGDSAANRDLKAQELADNSATNSIKRDAAGVDLETAKQMQKLQSDYINAKTPEAQAAAAKKIQTLAGKQDKDNRFTVVPGGQEFDAAAGVMRNVPARVLNNQTGQFVDGGQGGQAQLPPGMTKQVGTSNGKPVYEDATGKRFIGG